MSQDITIYDAYWRPDGLFVFIGQQPNTAFLKDSGLLLDDHGFILTGHALTHHPAWPADQETSEILATNLPGATAALLIREYLHST